MSKAGPKVLLVVGGGIAAYKSCELVRLIRKGGGDVTCVVTKGGQQFVTPMSLAALSENQVYTSLFDLKNEVEMGHIELSREADLIDRQRCFGLRLELQHRALCPVLPAARWQSDW